MNFRIFKLFSVNFSTQNIAFWYLTKYEFVKYNLANLYKISV